MTNGHRPDDVQRRRVRDGLVFKTTTTDRSPLPPRDLTSANTYTVYGSKNDQRPYNRELWRTYGTGAKSGTFAKFK